MNYEQWHTISPIGSYQVSDTYPAEADDFTYDQAKIELL